MLLRLKSAFVLDLFFRKSFDFGVNSEDNSIYRSQNLVRVFSMLEIAKSKVSDRVRVALGHLEVLTKKLKVMYVSEQSSKRKIVISSKDLLVSGMEKGTKIKVISTPTGFVIRKAHIGDNKMRVISSRTYSKRNYEEPVLDIRHQEHINQSIGRAEHVHIIFKKDEIRITPVFTKEAQAKINEQGLAININQTDEQGLYSSIITALNVIKDNHFAHITVDTEPEFLKSQEFVLFSLQLRRLGYKLAVNEHNQFTASFASIPTPSNIIHIDVNRAYTNKVQTRAEINRSFDLSEPLSTFTLCTGGVDISALEEDGFNNTMSLKS